MKTNLIPLIAKELGVEIGEEFEIKNSIFNPYKFTETELVGVDGVLRECLLVNLVMGKNKIEKLPKRPILTEDEKAILRSLPDEYKWIARDGDNYLCLYENAPDKKDDYWYDPNKWISLSPFDHLFKFIKWEDEEPYNIEELLKE